MKKLSSLTAIASIVSTATLLAFSSASFADHANYKADYKNEAPCPPEPCLKDGFYVGIGLGYDNYRVRQSTSLGLTTEVNSLGAFGEIVTANPPLSARGWNGSIFAGYGQYFDYFYIGAELLANTTNAQVTYGTGEGLGFYDAKFDVNASYGVSLLPGVRLSNATMMYVRLGYLRTEFKARETFVDDDLPLLVFSGSTTEWKNGFQYGLGMETLVCDNLSLRGEYTRTQYSSFRSSDITSWDPSNNQAVLSLIYHFA